MHARADTAVSWPEEIFSILQRFEVRQVPYVPDAGHSELIERVLGSSSMRGIALTTEEAANVIRLVVVIDYQRFVESTDSAPAALVH